MRHLSSLVATALLVIGGFASLLVPVCAEEAPSAKEPSAKVPVKGDISPTKTSDETFTAQPSGLPASERTTVFAAPLIGPQREKIWSLPELVDEALRRNPSTRQAWETARASEADLGVAKSAYYPTVTLAANLEPSHSTSPTYPGTSTVDQIAGGPQLQIQYLLLDFGARRAGVEAARFNLLAQNFTYNNTLQSVVLTVMTNYYNLDFARAQLENAEIAVKLAQTSLESTDVQSRVGLAAVTDVFQARQTLAQNQFNLENARGAVNQAQVQLLTSVGIPGNAKLAVAPPTERPSAQILEMEVDKLIDMGLRRRPDLASRYAQWRAQLAVADQAEANRWPQLTTGVNLERSYYTAHANPGGGHSSFNGDGHYDTAAALLTFSWDIFDGGNKLNAARSAKRQAEAARAALVSAELGAIADVVVNFIAFKTASKSVEAAEALLKASQESYDSVNVGYQNGLNNILDLLTAQNNLTSARAALAQSRSSLYTSAANLANATGNILPNPVLANNGATTSTTSTPQTPATNTNR